MEELRSDKEGKGVKTTANTTFVRNEKRVMRNKDCDIYFSI